MRPLLVALLFLAGCEGPTLYYSDGWQCTRTEKRNVLTPVGKTVLPLPQNVCTRWER